MCMCHNLQWLCITFVYLFVCLSVCVFVCFVLSLSVVVCQFVNLHGSWSTNYMHSFIHSLCHNLLLMHERTVKNMLQFNVINHVISHNREFCDFCGWNPSGSQGQSPWYGDWGQIPQKLNSFADLTVNFICNFTYLCLFNDLLYIKWDVKPY